MVCIDERHQRFGGPFAGFLQNVLGSEKKVWREPGNPMRQGDNEVVTVLFVHSGLHLREFFVNRGMVPKAPMEKGVSASSVGYEMVWAAR